jgi:DNA-directed RNA polymerase specialized sigma24 family protein
MKPNDKNRSLNIHNLAPVTTLATPSPSLGPEDCPESDAPPRNDNAVRGGALDTTPLAAHRDFARYVRATLARHGVRQRDMDDAIADVQVDAIEAARRKRMPANLEEWKALGVTIAVRRATKRRRKMKVARKYDAGLCEEPDRYLTPTLHWEHRDPVDTKRYLATLKELFDAGEMPERGEHILQGEADEVPHEELAQELGISRTAVDNRLSRMRARFQARLAALGMLVLSMLVLLAIGNRRAHEVAAPAPSDVPAPVPVPVEPTGDAAPETRDAEALPDAAGWR